MDKRNEFIDEWWKQERTFTELCAGFMIARKTGYKWPERFQGKGREGPCDRSRAPHDSPQAVAPDVAQPILQQRQKHPRWGARKLRESLAREKPQPKWPAASTIGELLKREGLTIAPKKWPRAPLYTEPLVDNGEPNQVWCADFKGWFRCGDGTRCDPLTITDACRYLWQCRAVAQTDGPHVRAVFETMFREYGMPVVIRTDHGAPFASTAPAGLSRLAMWWIRLGIRHERIVPGCPQQNGRHERMHKTVKQETASPAQRTLRQQQQCFARFQREFNQQRPHEALQYCTPADVYVASARSDPARLPELDYPNGVQYRRISPQGSLKSGGQRTFLIEVLAREMVGLWETEEDIFGVYWGPVLLGAFNGARHRFRPVPGRRRKPRAQPAAASS